MTVVDEFKALMQARGTEPYGENISIAAHSLLTALAAEKADASESLVVACLMHDVGHWLDEPDDAYGIYSHAELGANWVARRFGLEVSEPVRLHVEAKRYLCFLDPTYHDRLSPASIHTLAKQGGPMNKSEAARFSARPYFDDACQLRQLEDEYGKLSNFEVPSLDRYAALLLKLKK